MPRIPWELTKWLTRTSRPIIERKCASENGYETLDAGERLVYEFWLFDAEQKNGGVSQYFCNRGLAQWDRFSMLAAAALPSFAEFAAKVDGVVGRSDDPYESVIESEADLDACYAEKEELLIRELQAAVGVGTSEGGIG